MGSKLSTHQKKIQLKRREIKTELNIKKQEKVVILLGDDFSGKSTMINQMIKLNGTNQLNSFIHSQYNLNSFAVNEYTDASMSQHASNSFKHLTLLNKYANRSISHFDNLDWINTTEVNTTNKIKYGTIVKYQLLLSGYINRNLNDDLIKLIEAYYPKHIISSYKLKMRLMICDLWNVKCCDYFMWHELYEYASAVIFVFDISCYDEYDNGINKFTRGLDLFSLFVNSANIKNRICFLNKMDKFKHKFIDKQIPLNVCKEFEDYPIHQLNDLSFAMNQIKKKILAKYQTPDENQVYFHFTCAKDQDNIERVFLDVNHIIINTSLMPGS